MDFNTRSSSVLNKSNCVAQIQKVFGKDGELVLKLWDNFPEEFYEEPFWVEIDSKGVPLYITSFKPQGVSRAVVVFEDWQSELLASELVGKNLYSELSVDDATVNDVIIGWTMNDISSGKIGVIKDISDSNSNPLIFVEVAGKECMVPLAEELIDRIDEKHQTIYVNLPEGLLDL